LTTNDGFSAAEVQMLTLLGKADLVTEEAVKDYQSEMTIYRIVVEYAFLNDIRCGAAVAALRAAYGALIHGKMYRHTEEFDNLIMQYLYPDEHPEIQ
jgi:hypothetical protein